MIRTVKIRKYERGLLFRDKEFREVLRPGWHWIVDPMARAVIRVVSVRDVWLDSPQLDVMVRSGLLGDEIRALDLKDYERALVWIDGRFQGVYGAGLRALWTVFHDVRVEIVDARDGRFDHEDLAVISASETGKGMIDVVQVEQNQVALLMDLFPSIDLADHYERLFGRRMSFVVQGSLSPSPFQDTDSELDEAKLQVSLGLRYAFQKTGAMEFGLTENVSNFDSTPDVGFHFGFGLPLTRLGGGG